MYLSHKKVKVFFYATQTSGYHRRQSTLYQIHTRGKEDVIFYFRVIEVDD